MLSIPLTVEEHQPFTNAWQAAISYGEGTLQATIEEVWYHAQMIYADHPNLLEAARITLGMDR
jgi:hypothetical protein